ncbi:Pycsar system effector family protein [Flavobacterium algicola]|uniref:Pycsar system effector family protein n=1 Tax=Flavobacterium algicola TaxID=556529 RepID=UPI001EFE4FEC|nr:Pycsar system effector family protein [Flavobacterium algicola]MCG9793393.1 DUF5706 domain-containing protein [Flavobacterium algicola]
MESILQKAESFVLNYLNENLKPAFIYHNFSHTQMVVSKVNEIIASENLTDDEKEIVVLAAWFHDIGYTVDKVKHENHSIVIASDFLSNENYPPQKLNFVLGCIHATKLTETPASLLEKILRDADFAHLASANYVKIAEQLRLEFENSGGEIYTDRKWIEENIAIFNSHKYYTKYANIHWTFTKNENLIELKKEFKKSSKKEDRKDDKKELEVLKDNKFDKSAEILFKSTSSNHLKLSYIADRKANILLSVNAIILSISLSKLIPQFDNAQHIYLLYPTVIFVSFSVVSIILSVIVTRPTVNSGKFTKEDIANRKVNLLFFGNFHKMELDDFEDSLKDIADDKEYLFSAMTKDLYLLGKVLDRKYRILRLNYNVFIIGIIISVLAFFISYKFLSNVI